MNLYVLDCGYTGALIIVARSHEQRREFLLAVDDGHYHMKDDGWKVYPIQPGLVVQTEGDYL